jgi:hypothetical protein
MISREHTGTDRSDADAGTETRSEGWPQRMERARQARNHREMAQLLLDGADTALADAGDDESLERAQWLLARAQRSLDACGADPAHLTLLCALMERQWQLAQHWQPLDHPGQRHAAREQVRDLAFEVVRRGERSEDLGQRVSVILRAAEALEALGDQSDAHALRTRALHRLGAARLRDTPPCLPAAAALPCRAATSYQ